MCIVHVHAHVHVNGYRPRALLASFRCLRSSLTAPTSTWIKKKRQRSSCTPTLDVAALNRQSAVECEEWVGRGALIHQKFRAAVGDRPMTSAYDGSDSHVFMHMHMSVCMYMCMTSTCA